MKKPQLFLLMVLFGWSLEGCSARAVVPCGPSITDEEVTRIADEFLKGKSIDPGFRKVAERRISQIGCNYKYEEAEDLDSFGVGIVVEIDRSGKVIDFYSSE